jgi:rhodanese-related sulfurtransferase
MKEYDHVPRLTQKELLSKLADPDIVVIDVRSEKDWQTSETKIRGATREQPKEWQSWLSKYPRDRFLVFYCA